jgi:hypothetical protein
MRSSRSVCQAVGLLALALAILPFGRVSAEERFALVVGNSRYENLLTLPSASRDAEAFAQNLRDTGFEVQLLTDAEATDLNDAVVRFGRQLKQAGDEATGLFYYAGFGVQFLGENYLLPTDIDLRELADIDLDALPTDTVLRQMRAARNKANIVILDASRTNPYGFLQTDGSVGLAEMRVPPDVFIAFAAQPGTVAVGGGLGGSLFSDILNAEILQSDRPIDKTFEAIMDAVETRSEGQQSPWFVSALAEPFSFNAPGPAAVGDPSEEELWANIRQGRDPQEIVSFIRSHPTSIHIPEAGALLSDVLAAVGADLAQQDAAAPAVSDTAAPGSDAATAANNQTQLSQGDNDRDKGFFAKSIAELMQQPPHFAPIEGLPAELWQDANCSTCHTWTKDDLCIQGLRYQSVEIGTGPIHPFGGVFRGKLKDWSQQGCE